MNFPFVINKKEFGNYFGELLNKEMEFKEILYELFINKGIIYLVGGFIRDFLHQRPSRDIDMIAEISNNLLVEIIAGSNLTYEINRHGGIKLKLNTISVDIWAIDENWAFKKKLVKLNGESKLHSIAKGCFYNYDALAINILDFSYNIQYYNEFVSKRTLDILQKRSIYKLLNPTKEANILRAFFIKETLQCNLSLNTLNYLYKTVNDLSNKDIPLEEHLLYVLDKYPKYKNVLTPEIIDSNLKMIKGRDDQNGHQFSLDFR